MNEKNIVLLEKMQCRIKFHCHVYAVVTWNVRICIGFNVTVVFAPIISSTKQTVYFQHHSYLSMKLTRSIVRR